MIDYQGKVALVTGAGSGIGRALAQALAARGASVVVADINEDGARETAAMIGAEALAVVCDLADPEAPAKLIDQAAGWKGRLDLVCSNAGMGHNRRLIKQEMDARARRLFEVNLFSNLRIVQAYVHWLTDHGASGHVMLTGSENSLSMPSAVKGSGLGLYAATKHGVLILAEWMRDEFAAGDVPVELHVLMPGTVYTPLVARHLPDPAEAAPELALIMPERCAEIALKGMDLGLFYIPTQAHLAEDMKPRTEGVVQALAALGLD